MSEGIGEDDVDRHLLDPLQRLAYLRVEGTELLDDFAGAVVVPGRLDLEEGLRERGDRRVELARAERELPLLPVEIDPFLRQEVVQLDGVGAAVRILGPEAD